MEQFRLWGTLVNAFAVILGSLIGLGIKNLLGKKTTYQRMESLSDCIFNGIGLCVLAIGITGTIKAAVNDQILAALAGSYVGSPENTLQIVASLAGEETLIVVFSMVLGAVIGHLCNLDAGINLLGDKIEKLAHNRFGNVAQGFVSASLLFCVGSMTIVGALNSGLQCDHTMLYTKSILDFIILMVFAASLGKGAIFSAIPVAILQGGVTALAVLIKPIMTEKALLYLSVVGNILIFCVGINLVFGKRIKVANLLPSILLAVLCAFIPIELI